METDPDQVSNGCSEEDDRRSPVGLSASRAGAEDAEARARHALLAGAMVGVGVAEGGGGPGPAEYYGEYYPEPYYVPEMCPHPQHPQHQHMCTVHTDYGGMPVVTSAAMMPPMLPPVLDDSMRHYLVPHQHHHLQPHPPHHPPHHPHHQPPMHYGPANGAGGSQHFYGPGYPAHFHQAPPHHVQHSPPPPVYQKDERTQRQYSKLKQKLERKQTNRNNEASSGASTPSLSPRKEQNGRGGGAGGGSGSGSGGSGAASSGAWSEGEGSSAGASVHGDDEQDTQAALDLLSATRTPQVSDMTPTSALVSWNSQVPEGVNLPNVDLTYELLLGDRGRYKAIYSGPSLSCRVRDLRPGCEYSVCLQISAGQQTGGASDAVTFRAPPAPPEKPPTPRATQRARTSLLLRWGAADENGARLAHYLLEVNAGDGAGFRELARPRMRQHTANNLRPQARYVFRVAAINECGVGEFSDECVAWTTGAPPPAPPPPALAHAAARALALAWPPPRGQETFTLQLDDPARGHGFRPVYVGDACAYTCTDLTRATDYRFRLCAQTDDGQGPWSPEVVFRTRPERPGAPGRPAPRGKTLPRSFRLRWEPPTDDGGAPINEYTLELNDGDGYKRAYSGPEREAHCDRLRPGTQYRARVRCANEAGDSEWSAVEAVATDAAAPAAAAAPEPAAPPRAASLAVRWRAPACTGGAPITEYRVEVTDAEGAVRLAYAGAKPECDVRDLVPGRPYRLTVTAVNRVGPGPASAPLAFTTAPAPPDAPDAPRAEVESARSARLEWDPPGHNGAPLLDYRLEMSTSSAEDAFAEVYRGRDTRYLVGSLTPFSPYFFRVCASNAAGRGQWSALRDVLTPRAPPGPPGAPRHEAGCDWLRLTWRAPAEYGAPVLRYRLRVDDAELETEDAAAERLLQGLAPDTVYRVRVAALSELGAGEWSDEARAATRPPPPAPPALRVAQANHSHLRLEWPASGGEGAHYCVEMRAADAKEFRPVYRGSARACKVKKLREATEYWFRIRASDERGGRGPWSEPHAAATPPAPPPAPRAPALTQPAPRQALAQWDALDDAEYVLQCAKGKDAVFKEVYSGAAAQFQLEELEYGGEYQVRVMAVRGGLASAWSAPARLAVGAAPAPRARRARPARALSPRHAALLLAAAFLVLAVLVAVLVQRLVEPRP